MNICLVLSGPCLWESTHPYFLTGDIQISLHILFSEVFNQSVGKNLILQSIKAIFALRNKIAALLEGRLRKGDCEKVQNKSFTKQDQRGK